MGPSAQEVPDKENKAFDYFDIKYSLSRGISCCDKIKKEDIIAIFSGIRPADYTEDFIVEKSKKIDGFIHVAGIQSPGLASAPAIAEMVINILKDDLEKKNKIIEVKDSYNPYREEKIKFRNLSREEQDKVIAENPKYGHIICRCEQITEGEILETFNSNLKPTTIDAVKRRTRAGMGRCQGGFCQPRVLEILARENKIDPTEVTLKGENSYILNKENR
jgi:glycerol-3-phosphate dehydrogenase